LIIESQLNKKINKTKMRSSSIISINNAHQNSSPEGIQERRLK